MDDVGCHHALAERLAPVEARRPVVPPLGLGVVGVAGVGRPEPAEHDLVLGQAAGDGGHHIGLEVRGVDPDGRRPGHPLVVGREQPEVGGALSGFALAGCYHVQNVTAVDGLVVEDLAERRARVGVDEVVGEDAVAAALADRHEQVGEVGTDGR